MEEWQTALYTAKMITNGSKFFTIMLYLGFLVWGRGSCESQADRVRGSGGILLPRKIFEFYMPEIVIKEPKFFNAQNINLKPSSSLF